MKHLFNKFEIANKVKLRKLQFCTAVMDACPLVSLA